MEDNPQQNVPVTSTRQEDCGCPCASRAQARYDANEALDQGEPTMPQSSNTTPTKMSPTRLTFAATASVCACVVDRLNGFSTPLRMTPLDLDLTGWLAVRSGSEITVELLQILADEMKQVLLSMGVTSAPATIRWATPQPADKPLPPRAVWLIRQCGACRPEPLSRQRKVEAKDALRTIQCMQRVAFTFHKFLPEVKEAFADYQTMVAGQEKDLTTAALKQAINDLQVVQSRLCILVATF